MENNIKEFHITFLKICDDKIERLSGKNYFAFNMIDALQLFINDPLTPENTHCVKYIVDRTNITYSEMNVAV